MSRDKPAFIAARFWLQMAAVKHRSPPRRTEPAAGGCGSEHGVRGRAELHKVLDQWEPAEAVDSPRKESRLEKDQNSRGGPFRDGTLKVWALESGWALRTFDIREGLVLWSSSQRERAVRCRCIYRT